jgi:shikimate kinase
MSPLFVLVGPPGAGKSTVGRLAADRLGVGFRDTDDDVEQDTGRAIADIFVEDGETVFRAMERKAVARALAEHDGVVALGGGAVGDAGTRALLHDHLVVLLDVGLAAAADRVGFSQARPLLAVNPRAELKRLMEERRPLYAEVATVTVPTDGRPVEDIVADVVAAAGVPR